MNSYQNVARYILTSWEKTVRYTPTDEGTAIGLPHPFTVPGMGGAFNELYYWDTFFTNRGLLLSGRTDLAICNCEDIAALIERFGYMPNGSRTFYIGRSQPPYFALMAKDIFDVTGDRAWFSRMLQIAEKEYLFWMKKRSAGNGLNCYGSDYPQEYYPRFLSEISSRIELDVSRDPCEAGKCYVAEAESGWDFNPRFSGRCSHFNPVDLNSLLYIYERIFKQYSNELSEHDAAIWNRRAEVREQLMQVYMEDRETGIWYDYDYVQKECSGVISAASFWPFFAGISIRKKGLSALLDMLELPHGITATVNVPGNYQWGYGKAWAPLNMVAIEALDKVGMQQDALRIAHKYIDLITENYEQTGGLWEKYDAVTGEVVHGSEYETPQMLGWTAGAYLWAMKRAGYSLL